MQQRYRPLLPDTSRLGRPPERGGGDGGGDHDGERLPKKRRTQTAIACDRCRKKKCACDGTRPTCSRCSQLDIPCEYTLKNENETRSLELKRHLEHVQAGLKDHADILKHLQLVPEAEAITIIRRLRSTPNIFDVLSAIRRNVSPHRPSDVQTARAVLPTTHSEIEFELVILHDMAYPALPPVDDMPSAPLENFVQSGPQASAPSPSSDTATPNARPLASAEGTTDNETVAGLMVAELPSPFRDVTVPARRVSPVSGPSRPQKYCDARLNDLSLKYWTKVPISDEFAARAISVYLEMDSAITGWFDIDLFLTDLVGHRQDHCSAFLVSSFLSIACQAYAGSDSRALSFSIAFLRDADLFWKAERSCNSHTTLAAMMVLSLSAAELGKDQLSREVLVSARRMAEEMNLLGIPHTSSAAAEFRQMSPETIRAMSHVAWGTYSYLRYVLTKHLIHLPSFIWFFSGGTPVPYPPILPIPGCESREGASVSEQPWPAHPLPPYMKYTFPALCRFWAITQEVLAVYLAKADGSVAARVPLAFAESKYQRLLFLTNTLVKDMARGKQSLSNLLIFWSLYHVSVLEIFRPFVQDECGEQRMLSFTSHDSTPKAVFNASLKQLRRIVFEYQTLIPPKLYSAFFNSAALHVSTTRLKGTNDPTWRFYFSLCLGYWKTGVQQYPVFAQVIPANLCVAVNTGAITTSEAYAIGEEFADCGKHGESAEVATSCIVDFEHAVSNMTGTRMHELAQRFDELAMFEAFTMGDYRATPESKEDSTGKGL